jgi:hypothetical protein
MRARLSPWLIAAATCWALGAQATNLGTIGPTYPVAEKNLLDVIMARLRAKEASGELKRHEQEARERAAYAVNNPKPVPGLHRAETARTFYFDPTFTLQSATWSTSTGAVLFPAGTRKNPLEVVSPVEAPAVLRCPRPGPGDPCARAHRRLPGQASSRSSWAAATWT